MSHSASAQTISRAEIGRVRILNMCDKCYTMTHTGHSELAVRSQMRRGRLHTRAHTILSYMQRPRWCVVGSSFIPVASLASRLSIARRRHVQRASSWCGRVATACRDGPFRVGPDYIALDKYPLALELY